MERLIVVSAILPIHLKKEGKDYTVSISPGGLVTALRQALYKRKAIWIGWAGTEKLTKQLKEKIISEGTKEGFILYPVSLSDEERENFFDGFSNGIIWPLFHTFQAYARFQPEYWEAYKKVNKKFATAIKGLVHKDDLIWVHDYHFFLLPGYLKKLNVKNKTAFFLHIPFPNPELFFKIPWRIDILRGLLDYDLIGFHTYIDRKNFLDCINELIEDIDIKVKEPITEISYKGRKIKIGVFPISIDFDKYNSLAKEAKPLKKNGKIILGIDRLDYTKGLIDKLKAYRYFLEKYPEFHCKVKLVQAVAPNIKKLPEYDQLKVEFEHLVSDINGRFGTERWTPVHYIARRIEFGKLISYYRYSDVCWVNSIKDGMNLVGKEYAASNIDENGVLLLSEFAGAATEIHDYSILVNPYDIEGTAFSLYKALSMEEKEKRRMMKGLREHIRKYNINWWSNTYLETAFGRKIEDFPILEDDIPLHEILS
ncbi:trehalose 6-phosphate synthase [Persephonella hydrogeniphila]|uniref:Trehalose 6-phosphate synthase n=1 Tax=Persephonella hydrogeniphila TaxID=198703 RepID=A0A285NPA9_9AQUI|nr:trehalose-6-phosphate synthase [Persephonella hydrogeniphila]SNZ11364.1 trehalose 6-phosphate synthase [Persephonella hydrogeniphila]